MTARTLLEAVQVFFSLPAKIFVFSGITSKTVSLIAIVLAVGAFSYIALQKIVLGVVFIVLSVAVLSASMRTARMEKYTGLVSKYYSAVAVKYVEMLFFLGLSFAFPVPSFLAFGLSMLSDYAIARVSLVVPVTYSKKTQARNTMRRFYLMVSGLLLSLFLPGFFGISVMEFFLYFIALIEFWVFIERFFYAKSLLQDNLQWRTGFFP